MDKAPEPLLVANYRPAAYLYHLFSAKEPYNEAVFHGCDEEALKRAISPVQTSRSTCSAALGDYGRSDSVTIMGV